MVMRRRVQISGCKQGSPATNWQFSWSNIIAQGNAHAEDAEEALPDDEAGQVIRLLLKFSSDCQVKTAAVC